MGMDGLSIANTGVVKESTSAEHSNKVEHAIQNESANNMRQVQSMSVNPRVRAKDDEEDASKQKKKNTRGDSEEFEDGYIEELPEEVEEIDVEDIENPNKDFYVKLNVKDDIIELYDSSSDRLIETISGNELGELVQKLNMASGIFVNKKV